MYALVKPADFEFPRERNLFTHVFTRVLSSQWRKQLPRARSALVLHEQTRIAVTKPVWTAAILDSSETRGPLSNDRTLS